MVRESVKLSAMTMVSRVLGLIRDHLQAVLFGTGPFAYAWEVAYMLPNMLRNLLAEGVLSQAFIPVYSDSLKQSPERAAQTAGVVLSFCFFGLSILVAIGVTILPILVPLFTGMTQEEASLTIQLSQIMFVFILTASLTALFAGISNTHQHFSFPALSPIILNLVFIGGFVYIRIVGLHGSDASYLLAKNVVAGGMIQLVIQIVYNWKQGWRPIYNFRFTASPELKKIFSLMAPAALGASLFQINQLTDIALASYLIPNADEAVVGLRFSQRLVQLPTGIIGVAISTAILPALLALIRSEQSSRTGEQLYKALLFSLALTLPAGIGLFILGDDIINLLFYGGAWNDASTQATLFALQFYAFGVPFYSTTKILTSSFYAYKDTKTPLRALIFTVVLNFVLNLILIPQLAQGGLTLSSTICAFLNTSLLLFLLRKKMNLPRLKILFSKVLYLVLPCILLVLILYSARFLPDEWVNQYALFFKSDFMVRERSVALLKVGCIGGIGGLLYLLIIYKWVYPRLNSFG